MKAKIIVAIIWGFYIFCSISGGINLPEDGMKYIARPVPLSTKLGLTLFPFIFSLIGGFQIFKKQVKPSNVDRFIELVLGRESFEEIKRIIHLKILGPLFFLLIGGIGLIKAKIIGLTGFGVYKILFPFCAGLGLAISFSIHELYVRNKK